jgi:hypothetical protein
MAKKLSNIIQGDTKRWRVEWPTDIAGATIKFIMKRDKNQAVADVEIEATLDAPDGQGEVFGGTFEITAEASTLLAVGGYHSEHEITLVGGDVGTFYQEKIAVTQDLN